MKNLYFMFAVLALPVMAFAEAGDSMTNQTTLKQPVKESKPKMDYRCDSNSEKCVQKSRHRFDEMKQDTRDHHLDSSAEPVSKEG